MNNKTSGKFILVLVIFLAGISISCAYSFWEDSDLIPEVRTEVYNSILSVNDTYHSDPHTISRLGVNHPFQTLRKFRRCTREAFLPGEKSHSFVQYAYADSEIYYSMDINFTAGYDQRSDDPGNYGFFYKGIRFNSQCNDRFRVRGNWWNGAFHGSRSYWEQSPLIDGYNNQNPDKNLLDNMNGDISYNNKYFNAAVGRGRFQIGNSVSGSIILSDKVNEYDYLLLEQRVGKFSFSLLNSILKPDSTKTPDTEDYPGKFFALHQMMYKPLDGLELFVGETVVYGSHYDLSYMLPFYFWRVGKYGMQEKDNLMIYGGANYYPASNLVIYLNVAIDELTYNKIFTDWWGNKYGVQTGVSIKMPKFALTKNESPVITLEATAIRPWTYTHYDNVTMYSNERLPLGYPKGSNLVDLTAELNLPLPWEMRWDSQFSCNWQGSVGNDWRLNYHTYFPGDIVNTAEAYWLEGDISFTPVWTNTIHLDFMAHHSFILGHSSTLNKESRHQLFLSWQFFY